MRVLFVNSRENTQAIPGGDTVQMVSTQAALEYLGLTVEAWNAHELAHSALPHCDIAHIFNMQTPEPAWTAMQALQARGTPVVLSPIYWDMYAHWAESAIAEQPRWRALAGRLGEPRTRGLYVRWQKLKSPTKALWRTQRRLLRRAARVLPNSLSEAVLLEHSFALGRGFQRKVAVVPNAIDTQFYQQLPAPNEVFCQRYGVRDFVLQVGTVYPAKNQLALIEALFDLPVPLVFIGQTMDAASNYVQQCRERAAQRGNTVFIDRLPHHELPGIYALAAVHALPSWRETPGLVSLEAAAAGCRIVTTSIGSTRDYFGDLAWYCHPSDLKSIRQAVLAALAAPTPHELRQRVLNRYTWQRAAEATVTAYEAALRRQQIDSRYALTPA
jgi:glycosyltransferase involved in cell wall biosynthesis